jgi:hypothetical protein
MSTDAIHAARQTLQIAAIRRLAKVEGRAVKDTLDDVVDAGIRVLLRKHELGCGFKGCKEHARGQIRLVSPEPTKPPKLETARPKAVARCLIPGTSTRTPRSAS